MSPANIMCEATTIDAAAHELMQRVWANVLAPFNMQPGQPAQPASAGAPPPELGQDTDPSGMTDEDHQVSSAPPPAPAHAPPLPCL